MTTRRAEDETGTEGLAADIVHTILFTDVEGSMSLTQRLGHASIAVMMDTYSHVMPTLQREAAEHLDRALAVR